MQHNFEKCTLGTDNILPHVWLIRTLDKLPMCDEPTNKVDVQLQLFQILDLQYSNDSFLLLLYCSTWQLPWPVLGCFLQQFLNCIIITNAFYNLVENIFSVQLSVQNLQVCEIQMKRPLNISSSCCNWKQKFLYSTVSCI